MSGVVFGAPPQAPEPEEPDVSQLTVGQLEDMGLTVLALDGDSADELHAWFSWLAYQPNIYIPIAAQNLRQAVDPYDGVVQTAQADKDPVRYGGDDAG